MYLTHGFTCLQSFVDRSGTRNQMEIREIHERYIDCLMLELRSSHPHRDLMPLLRRILLILKDLAHQHVNVLAKFKKSSPVDLPPLYKELFTVDN